MSLGTKAVKSALFGLGSTVLLASAAHAAPTPVTVNNADFGTGDLSGWQGTQSGANIWNCQTSVVGSGAGAYAKMHGDTSSPSNPAYLYQDVGLIQPNTTYELTVTIVGTGMYAIRNTNSTIALLNGTDQTGATVASADLGSLPGDWSWYTQDVTATYTSGASPSGRLTIYMASNANYNFPLGVANIRLTADAVPEPAMLGLAGLAAVGTLSRRKRQAA